MLVSRRVSFQIFPKHYEVQPKTLCAYHFASNFQPPNPHLLLYKLSDLPVNFGSFSWKTVLRLVDQDSCDEPQSLKKELVDSGRNLSISINQGLNICLLCSLMNATQNLQETLCGQDRLGHGIKTCLDTIVPPLSLSPSCCCHAQNCCDDALSTTQMHAYVVHGF